MSSLSSLPTARAGLVQICLAGILWGTGGLAVQLIRQRVPMPTMTISAYRMVGAAVALLVTTLLLGRIRELRFGPRVVLVGTATGAYQALYFAAVVQTGVTVATVVSLGLAPVLLTVADLVRSGPAPTPSRSRQLLVLAAALCGLVLVTVYAGLGTTGPRPLLGTTLAAAGGATYALATAAGRPLARSGSPLSLTTAATVAGALVLLPFGLWAARDGAPLATADPTVVGLLAYLALATMALGYALLYAGLRTTRASAATVATLMEPVTAAASAAVVLGERLGLPGTVGIALILAAVACLG